MVARAAYKVSHHRAFNYPSEVSVAEFIALGIDDLAKYRIVQLLCARPEICWDAGLVAERLGLRPLERTVEELEELADRHLVERQDNHSNAKYKLTMDKSMRLDLSLLFALARNPQVSAHILAHLASRSLERILAKGKAGKGRIRCVPQSLDPIAGN